MKKVYGVLLVGCGRIGGQHIEAIYQKKEEVRIIATIDSDEERAAEFARMYGAETYGTDYHVFLKDPRVDIVIIATYTDTHLPILRDCLAGGKHVICEKPVAVDLAGAREFVRLVKDSDCKVAVSHVMRYNQSYRTIKEMIDSGEIGELRMVRMNQSHRAGEPGHPWERFLRLMEDCPPLVDCGVHYADVISWFADSPIVAVGGVSSKLDDDAPIDNYQIMTMELANGCRGYYEVGWSRNVSSNSDKDFIGTKGHISLTMAANRKDGVRDKDLVHICYGDPEKPDRLLEIPSIYKDMYRQFCNLVDMIENGGEGAVPTDAVFDAFRAVKLAMRAIQEGRRIVLADEPDGDA